MIHFSQLSRQEYTVPGLFITNGIDEAFPVTWLETGYKLTPNEAAVVAHTTLRYDIAEIVDPLVHVVGKIPKEAVAKLK